MDRRDFLKSAGKAGAMGLIGGWLSGLSKPAEALASSSEEKCLAKEWDETWGDTPVHVIEMTIPYDEPTVLFLKDQRRYLVPRQNENEIRYDPSGTTKAESLDKLLQDRLQAMKGIAAPYANQNRALLLIAHCPKGTDYGLVYGFDHLTIETMMITAPAKLLFK